MIWRYTSFRLQMLTDVGVIQILGQVSVSRWKLSFLQTRTEVSDSFKGLYVINAQKCFITCSKCVIVVVLNKIPQWIHGVP